MFFFLVFVYFFFFMSINILFFLFFLNFKIFEEPGDLTEVVRVTKEGKRKIFQRKYTTNRESILLKERPNPASGQISAVAGG